MEGAEEVLLVMDDAPPGIVGQGDDSEGAGIRREAVEDISEHIVRKLMGWWRPVRLVAIRVLVILHGRREEGRASG